MSSELLLRAVAHLRKNEEMSLPEDEWFALRAEVAEHMKAAGDDPLPYVRRGLEHRPPHFLLVARPVFMDYEGEAA